MSATRQWRPTIDRVTSRRMNTKSIPVVSSTSDIADTANGIGPFTGQVILNLTDNMLYRYDGTSWVAFSAGGGGYVTFLVDEPNRSHEARYFATASQSIANAADTKLQFPNVFANSSADITPSGTGNTDFLFNRGGVWYVEAGLRYFANAGGGERHLFLQTGTSFDVTKRFGWDTDTNVGNTGIQLSTSATIEVDAGTSIFAAAFQNAGASVDTDPLSAVSVHGAVHLTMVWLRPR